MLTKDEKQLIKYGNALCSLECDMLSKNPIERHKAMVAFNKKWKRKEPWNKDGL